MSRIPWLAGALALVALGVAIGISLPKPPTAVVQPAPPPTQDGDHAGGIFIGGATGMFAGQPAVGPPPPPRSLIPTFPYWELLPLLPSREEWRHFLGIEPPVCDSSRHTIRSTTQKPFIARFPPSADGLKRVDTAIAGAAIPLCTPRDIAIGPDGALYVLDLHPRLYDETPGLRALVKIYERDAAPDDAPARVFAVAEDAIAMSVDSAGQVWTSSRRVGEVIRVYGPRARKEPEPVRVIDGWNAWAPSVLGIEVDSRGNSYVTAGEVVVYPPSAREGDPPVRKITGPATSLRSPVDLAIGPGDTLYVLNALGTWRCGRGAPAEVSVTVYPPGADGNVKPVRRIMLTGEKAPDGLAYPPRPTGLTVDQSGAVYVSFGTAQWIAVFAPGARGNAVPVRNLYPGAEPQSLAIGKDGALYVLAIPGPRAVSCRWG